MSQNLPVKISTNHCDIIRWIFKTASLSWDSPFKKRKQSEIPFVHKTSWYLKHFLCYSHVGGRMREPSNEFISFPMFCSVILCVCGCVCVFVCVCVCDDVFVCVCIGGHVKGWVKVRINKFEQDLAPINRRIDYSHWLYQQVVNSFEHRWKENSIKCSYICLNFDCPTLVLYCSAYCLVGWELTGRQDIRMTGRICKQWGSQDTCRKRRKISNAWRKRAFHS
jgi:hypothetical protein